MTIKKWDLKQKDRLLPINPEFKGNVTQKRITTSFSLLLKKTFVDDHFADLLPFKHRKNKVQQHCHWSPLYSSWIKELPYLEQAYHLHASCLLCFEDL